MFNQLDSMNERTIEAACRRYAGARACTERSTELAQFLVAAAKAGAFDAHAPHRAEFALSKTFGDGGSPESSPIQILVHAWRLPRSLVSISWRFRPVTILEGLALARMPRIRLDDLAVIASRVLPSHGLPADLLEPQPDIDAAIDRWRSRLVPGSSQRGDDTRYPFLDALRSRLDGDVVLGQVLWHWWCADPFDVIAAIRAAASRLPPEPTMRELVSNSMRGADPTCRRAAIQLLQMAGTKTRNGQDPQMRATDALRTPDHLRSAPP